MRISDPYTYSVQQEHHHNDELKTTYAPVKTMYNTNMKAPVLLSIPLLPRLLLAPTQQSTVYVGHNHHVQPQ